MAHAEDLLVEGARRAAVAIRELWWRGRPEEERGEVPLERVKRRVDLFVSALSGHVLPILPADPPPAPTWLARVFGRAPRHLDMRLAIAATDGERVWLPRRLRVDDDCGAMRTYRLLALEQVARALRGTPSLVPLEPLERDLYLLAESVAVDRILVRDFPGLASDLVAERSRALRERPSAAWHTPLERRVDAMVCEVLASDPLVPPAWMTVSATPGESRAWARRLASDQRRGSGRYRGLPVVALWGGVARAAVGEGDVRALPGRGGETPQAPRVASLRHRPSPRHADADEDGDAQGTWMVRPDEPMESAEDPMGLQRPADRDDDANAGDLADVVSELPEARVVRTPASPREVLTADEARLRTVAVPHDAVTADGGLVYPELDYRRSAYRRHGAVVRPRHLSPGSAEWVDDVLRRRATLVRRVRRRFEGLRARRLLLGRQTDGPDLDLAAYVSAFADRRGRHAGDDRFYVAARRVRRDLALMVLVDASASTDSWVSGALRVIDVEKEAVIVLLEALDAVGDRHAALAFTGEGPGDVRVATLKDFDARGGVEVHRRVAALEPDGYTRAGAAIRHASTLLAREAARHRLLLILSDGKPNDVDEYEGRYGIEDTRQAVAEARVQGVVPFCLTVDRAAPTYVPSIFGPAGYAMLPRQEALTSVLVEVVRRLLRP